MKSVVDLKTCLFIVMVIHNNWEYLLSYKINCSLDDDLLFTNTNFTLSIGNRICFDAIIIDDDIIEYMKYYEFHVHLQNRTYHRNFYDYTHIRVTDNEGWFLKSLSKTCRYNTRD